jgi:DNA-binding transcriptional LysR family regulator
MPAMRLRHIEVFQAIMEAGTLTGAASILNISQPAATKLLQQAERRLGFALFVRAKGRLHLTPESMLLKGQIERISDELRDLQRLASNVAQAGKYVLRAVSTPTLANSIVPKSITRLRQNFGNTAIELSTQHSREMLTSILLRETDIGLTLQELNHPDVRCEPLCIGSLALIAPPGTWPKMESVQPIGIDWIAGSQLVGIATMDSLGRQLQAYLERLTPAPRITTWVQTYQIAKELVCAGEGLALVDPFTAVSAGPDVQIRTVVPNFPVRLYAAYRIDGPLNSVQKTFLQCVEGVSRELIDALQGVGTEAA